MSWAHAEWGLRPGAALAADAPIARVVGMLQPVDAARADAYTGDLLGVAGYRFVGPPGHSAEAHEYRPHAVRLVAHSGASSSILGSGQGKYGELVLWRDDHA